MTDIPEIIEQAQGSIIYEMCEILNVSLQNSDGTYRNITDIFLELGEKIFGQKNADFKDTGTTTDRLKMLMSEDMKDRKEFLFENVDFSILNN